MVDWSVHASIAVKICNEILLHPDSTSAKALTKVYKLIVSSINHPSIIWREETECGCRMCFDRLDE